MFEKIDALVVGAGPSGIVSARKLAEAGKKVLIIEKKNHIAGHCYDEVTDYGISIHKYGPHIFHTNYKDVWDFLSTFTGWYDYQHAVIASIDGKLLPVPFNFNSIEKLLPHPIGKGLTKKLVDIFGYGKRISIFQLRMSHDKDIRSLAELIYKKVFRNYSAKQWGINPDEIDPSVFVRVPVVLSRDDRYFHDKYQGIPSDGYTALFNRMIDHEYIQYQLNTDSRDFFSIINNMIVIDGQEFQGEVIYTGMIDELFDFSEGELPYRSTKMVFEEHDLEYFQENSVVNYPNDYDYTRISEFKYFQIQRHINKTIICKEYPREYIRGKNDPYYILKNDDNLKIYKKYKVMVSRMKRLHMVGRLANYSYYDMDDVIHNALETSNGIISRYENNKNLIV